MAQILVILDLYEGLSEEINIIRGKIKMQGLDYEGVPSQCNRSHNYDHLVHC